MDNRRDFLKKATLLAGAAAVLPPSIQRAFAINPDAGTTFLDAEHIVILMQENRSFDHCYGSLQGVRGFNDPRAIQLPNKNLAFLQTNAKGETFAPFRLNMKGTNATWMGSLPHSWTDQVDTRNGGRFDQWLESKKSSHKDYKEMPLTMGYYNREDIPFYYSFADAFTVCDQNFCSSLTGTTPNRLHLWTGKIREDRNAQARVRNEEADYGVEAAWKTFPERLEDNNVSWKIYQNEISVGVGFQGEEDAWLANFGDNPMEYFTQFQVRSHEKCTKYTKESYDKLSDREKSIHKKAFTTNAGDPNYHKLTTLKYKDGDTEREMLVPAGDIFYQFREDVKTGNLPAVSWLVAPEKFSDHPTSPWYGAWYVSEAMDILTKNPEVWKKTIFILCYDENDGYFDHVPPFVSPVPGDESTGRVSKNIDTHDEYVPLSQDLQRKPAAEARGSSIGLGYRVPLVIASPWSRGGAVCSQVFDHTSILQLLEKFASHKSGKKVEESNISSWRRTVCGDLTSVFKPFNGEKVELPAFLERNEFVQSIHEAKFKDIPSGFHALTSQEVVSSNQRALSSAIPRQEKGTRVSRPLPYQLYANTKLVGKELEIRFEARNDVFGGRSAGAPFHVYSFGKEFRNRSYAVAAGDAVTDRWKMEDEKFHFRIYGPNGFFRECRGHAAIPGVEVQCEYETKGSRVFTGNVVVTISNSGPTAVAIQVKDNSYNQAAQAKEVAAGGKETLVIFLRASDRWYDSSVLLDSSPDFEYRFAGRVETGEEGMSDPAMG